MDALNGSWSFINIGYWKNIIQANFWVQDILFVCINLKDNTVISVQHNFKVKNEILMKIYAKPIIMKL